jgi:hypothetical protein
MNPYIITIDMNITNYINAPHQLKYGLGWYRCKFAHFSQGEVSWQLNRAGWYSFTEAYEKIPHRRLMLATNDRLLQSFIKAWGPLCRTLSGWSGTDGVDNFRNRRDNLRSVAKLLSSVENPRQQRAALSCLPDLPFGQCAIDLIATLRDADIAPNVTTKEEFQLWLKAATQDQADAAAVCLSSQFRSPDTVFGFAVDKHANNFRLFPVISFQSLSDALYWMLWEDIFRGKYFWFCEECDKLVSPKSGHARKFCSPECAHRKTAREWQQRKRTKEKPLN